MGNNNKMGTIIQKGVFMPRNGKGRLRFAKRRHFSSNRSLDVCAAVLIQGRLLFESFIPCKEKVCWLHLMIFYLLSCDFIISAIATLAVLSHTAINIQEKAYLAFTRLFFHLLQSILNSSDVYIFLNAFLGREK